MLMNIYMAMSIDRKGKEKKKAHDSRHIQGIVSILGEENNHQINLTRIIVKIEKFIFLYDID
jgi:hypothetical protein